MIFQISLVIFVNVLLHKNTYEKYGDLDYYILKYVGLFCLVTACDYKQRTRASSVAVVPTV